MGTLTVAVSTASPVATVYSHPFSISDADLARIIAANQIAANAFYNGTATNTQVATFIIQQWINQLSQQVVSFGQQTAIGAIPPTLPIVAS